jgi:hypothetical protein
MDTIYYIDRNGNSIEYRYATGRFGIARVLKLRAAWFGSASQAIVKACSFTGG